MSLAVRFIFYAIKLICLKLKLQKRIRFYGLKQKIKMDTKVEVGKTGLITLDEISTQNNVHLISRTGELEIGKGVSFNRNCVVVCRKSIKIGHDCLFGPNVCIYDHDHIFGIEGLKRNEYTCKDIVIEDGCWIGAGVIILKGSYIGKNSVIGAGTIIKSHIPANSLVVTDNKNKIIKLKDLDDRTENDGTN